MAFVAAMLFLSCSGTGNPRQGFSSAPSLNANPGNNASGAENTALFRDDFENGTVNWRTEDGWTAVREGNNTVLQGKGHEWVWLKSGTWKDYSVSARFKLVKGAIHFNVKYNSENRERYFAGVSLDEIYLNKQTGEKLQELANKPLQLSGGWHSIEIKSCSGLINVSVDGRLYIVCRDENFISAGSIAFEALEETEVLLDDIVVSETHTGSVEQPPAAGQTGPVTAAPDKVHKGDLVLNGSKKMIIEDMTYLQQGNVYINDNASLVIRNATFILGRGDVPTIHTYFFVAPGAALQIDNCSIAADRTEEMGALIIIRNEGTVKIVKSKTAIHLIEMYKKARLSMIDSEMVNPIGGLLQIAGGKTELINSTVGALALAIPAGARMNVNGLKSGMYYEAWDVHDMIPEAGYDLKLSKTTILKDDLAFGPYERGWLFFPHPDSSVNISESELRKVFISLKNETASFENLKMGKPSNLSYKNIRLKDVVMMGEWPFEMLDSKVTIKDSEYLFLQPQGKSELTLVNSHMVEFIPRDFKGIIHFENCTWTNAGEIIGGQAYHSKSNDFTITGSLKIAPELKKHLQWKNAKVTREYTAVATGLNGEPLEGLTVKIGGKSYTTDRAGGVRFNIVFNENNYNAQQNLDIYEDGKLIRQSGIDFFTETPVLITR